MALRAIELTGSVNVGAEQIRANMAINIRRMLPQAQPHSPQPTRIALIGGGPSLTDTEAELRAQILHDGVKVCTVNGAYRWCLERHIRPSMHVQIDARAFNARFLEPAIPGCRYLLASQCAPETFDASAGRDVTIFHCLSDDKDEEQIVKDWYSDRYHVTMGGTTVMLRAIGLLRMLGFLRIDIYGMDSCWLGDKHHAYEQPENNHDQRIPVWMVPQDPVTLRPRQDLARQFWCDPWMMKQHEEFFKMLRVHGEHFYLNVHGDGLIAHSMRIGADLANLKPGLNEVGFPDGSGECYSAVPFDPNARLVWRDSKCVVEYGPETVSKANS